MIELTRAQVNAIALVVTTQDARLSDALAGIGVKLVDSTDAKSSVPEDISAFSATFLGPEAVAEVERRERERRGEPESGPFVIGGSQP